MIPWYWLIVAAAVPTLWALWLRIELRHQRKETFFLKGDYETRGMYWYRMYCDEVKKIGRIKEFLDDKYQPAQPMEKK